jgi:TusA-related sulfurtransferase
MVVKKLDTSNLQHPYPILEMASKLAELEAGDILEVIGEGETFEGEIRVFCKRINKPLLSIENDNNGTFRCQIQQV